MKTYVSHFLIAIGFFLLSLNLYGLTQTLRPSEITEDSLRFGDGDQKLTYGEFVAGIRKIENEGDADYVKRLTHVIADGIAHIHWGKYHPEKFHQRVPVWENYILFAMGHLSGIPEFERYHFTQIEKSVERGIGVCGDAAMLMSLLLDKVNIENEIVSMPGHVMISAKLDHGVVLADPDFGVFLNNSPDYFMKNRNEFLKSYFNAGFQYNGAEAVYNSFMSKKHKRWAGVEHFVTKKYYFERISYVFIWLLPLLMLITGFSILLSRRGNREG